MSKVVSFQTPKARFLESGDNISKHRDLLQQREFERAMDWALLQYQRQLCEESGDLNQAASKHLRIQGVYEFLKVLYNLSETPVMTAVRDIGNLDHRV